MLSLSPQSLISAIITLVVALTFHEFAHAWMAKRFGDDTAERAGRLTLNPLVHLDPIGSLMLVFVGFGWAKPVPINPYTIRRSGKTAMLLVSPPGPLANVPGCPGGHSPSVEFIPPSFLREPCHPFMFLYTTPADKIWA